MLSVTIHKASRFSYYLSLHDGLLTYSNRKHAWSLDGARRKAQQWMVRERRSLNTKENTWVIPEEIRSCDTPT